MNSAEKALGALKFLAQETLLIYRNKKTDWHFNLLNFKGA